MLLVLLASLLSGAYELPADTVVSAEDTRVERSPDFAVQGLPYALNRSYACASAQQEPTQDGIIRVPSPKGAYYVYLAWVRHPQGANDVRVRVGNHEVRVDQSRMANGSLPDDYARDDMTAYDGLCTSGLYRLTDQPVLLEAGDAFEMVRSDTQPGTVTTLDYVVFSPHLYLDDFGNDSRITGPVLMNLLEYRAPLSGPVGLGIAFVGGPGREQSSIEWTVPTEGLFLLSVNVNRGPSRAETFHLKVVNPQKPAHRAVLHGYAAESVGRDAWQAVGVLHATQETTLQLAPPETGMACADLLRLTPLSTDALSSTAEARHETVTVQWEDASDAMPWLTNMAIVSSDGTRLACENLKTGHGMPNGVLVRVPAPDVPVFGESGRVFRAPWDGSIQIQLADDYGFSLSSELLAREPFVWLRDLGIFVCNEGNFKTHGPAMAAIVAEVDIARGKPFRATSEKFYEHTGLRVDSPRFDYHGAGALKVAYNVPHPLAPRVTDSLATIPEVDYEHFFTRIDDSPHRTMFLGWPDVSVEFYIQSNGAIGVSARSVKGTGHPLPEYFLVRIAVGDTPEFKEHGDPAVTQSIDDNYHMICHTNWRSSRGPCRATAFAYPLDGEDVQTGYEPLGAFVRVQCNGAPVWLELIPRAYNDRKDPEFENPISGLAEARIEDGVLVAGTRNTAVVTGKASIEEADETRVLVRIEPDTDTVDLVIPGITVDRGVLQSGAAIGFDRAHDRTKTYWDKRIAAGATVQTPSRIVNDFYKTLHPRVLMCADLDTDGDYALKTGPVIYDTVWLSVTALGIEGLARRGHFEEAKRYLAAAFDWQGTQGTGSAEGGSECEGRFAPPPKYPAPPWVNFHGWMQWAAARYFLYSDDREWLDEKLPQLIKGMEWLVSRRQLTKVENEDGTRPVNYGWLPGGRVTDGSSGTSAFSDSPNWAGLVELTRLLERIGHPRAAEFRAESDDYRACIVRGLRLAARNRDPVRLNDGTYVPYVPGYLESRDHEESMWYAAVVDAALEGILDLGVLPPGEPMESWLLNHLEDNLFVFAPNLADEAYYAGHAFAYVRRDQPEHAVYTLFSLLASHMSRQTLTTFEHRSWGRTRIFELTPWAMGYHTRLLANMLCDDDCPDHEKLIYCRATPRAWFDPGKSIRIEDLQTRFGPTSFTFDTDAGQITGIIRLPKRYPPGTALLRLRVNGIVTSVDLNGSSASIDDRGYISLPVCAGEVTVRATVQR